MSSQFEIPAAELNTDDPKPSDAIALFRSISADAGIGADPQYPVGGIPGQVDNLILRHEGHGRTCDRSGQPVPRLDERVLRPQVVLEGTVSPSAAMPAACRQTAELATGRDGPSRLPSAAGTVSAPRRGVSGS
jgi:hypothetical protein